VSGIASLAQRAGCHEVKADMDVAIAKGIAKNLLAELKGQAPKEEGRGLVCWSGFVDGLDPRKGRDEGLGWCFRRLFFGQMEGEPSLKTRHGDRGIHFRCERDNSEWVWVRQPVEDGFCNRVWSLGEVCFQGDGIQRSGELPDGYLRFWVPQAVSPDEQLANPSPRDLNHEGRTGVC
jgi:hypothetical protein